MVSKKMKKNKNVGVSLRHKVKKQKPLNAELVQLSALASHYMQRQLFSQAQTLYRQILEQRPNHAETNQFMGLLLHQLNQSDLAIPYFEKAIKLDPNNTLILGNYGVVLKKIGQVEESLLIYEKAIKINPKLSRIHYNLGISLAALTRYSEAVASYDKAIKLEPGNAQALNNRGNALLNLCLPERARESFSKAFSIDPSNLTSASNVAMTSLYLPQIGPEELFSIHKDIAARFPSETVPKLDSGKVSKRIRVGYISSDFRTHSVAYFVKPLLKSHDKSRFDVYCYQTDAITDDVTHQLRLYAEHWSNIANLTVDMLVKRIRADKIDILVDLNGHSANNRLAVFSMRAAPIQVTWLGYPYSTGLNTMDYRISDNITDPEGESKAFHTESVVRLPNGFLCYEGDPDIQYDSTLPSDRTSIITFGSFNNLIKVNREVVSVWSEILKRVPNSRLIIKSKQFQEESILRQYMDLFEEFGIAKGRLDLISYVEDRKKHMELYSKIDIGLDTFPYNGTTTTCEALWMGVPTVTMLGDRHPSRVGAYIMKAVGLGSFVASSPQEYVDLAVRLASDKGMLSGIRENLRSRMQQSDLCNAKLFTENMEVAFELMISKREATHGP